MKLSLDRTRARRSSLGAAMAEGGVVLPVLAVFFGMMMYVHNAYQQKALIQAESRFAAFSSAAHGCKRAPEGATKAAGDQRGVEVDVPAEANAPDEEKDAAVETTWLEITANKTATATALRRTTKVTAFSTVYCNPHGLDAGAAAEGLAKLFAFAQHAFGFVPQWAKGLIR